MTRYYILQ